MATQAKRPRPRVLFVESTLSGRDDIDELMSIAPTTGKVSSFNDAHLGDWDVVVTDVPFAARHAAQTVFGLAVMTKEGIDWGRPFESQCQIATSPSRSPSVEFQVNPGTPSSIRSLAESDLLPLLRDRVPNLQLQMKLGSDNRPSDALVPFVTAGDGAKLAGLYKHSEGGETWLLPRGADLCNWLRTAFEVWARASPESFPPDTDAWQLRTEWLTLDERRAKEDLEANIAKRQQVVEEIDAKLEAAKSRLAAARRAANNGDRKLLAAGGRELVDCVVDVLERLGFRVSDMDVEATVGSKREDLRLTVTDDGEWLALVEVRGHTRGAKTQDITKLLLYQSLYARENAGRSARIWYVVNQLRGQDPASRDPVLHADEETLDVLVEADGLAMDTTALYQIARRLESAEIRPEAVRERLMQWRGRVTSELWDPET